MGVPSPAHLVRFGAFQLDLRARELRRHGIKVRVPDQSLQILAMLLAHPGEVVTREELHRVLWPNGTIVEFEHSVNAAIKRLRQALEDSADEPTYVETVPRVGYRFIGRIEPGVQNGAMNGEAAAADLDVQGKDLSHYRILDQLGVGGMGVVYRAQDTRLNRTVAIKMLSADFSSNPQARERLEREARAIAALNHPHVCQLYDVGRSNGTEFLALEYLEGETLAHRLEKGPLDPEQVLRFAIQIADALSAAHRRNVIHRDLKPGNLMLTRSGIKLLDFGVAKVRAATAAIEPTAPAEPLTREGSILGTVQYMAPEQLERKEADARTDIFALGSVIYEMATGRAAFAGDSHAGLVSAIMRSEPEPISQLRPLMPAALDHVVRTCLAKDPDARWQTAHDVQVELEWIAEAGPSTETPHSTPSRLSRREMLAWTCCGAASVAAISTGVLHLRGRSADSGRLHLQVVPPPKLRLVINGGCGGNPPVISPDGRQLALVAANGGDEALWLRTLASPEIRRLPQTEGARMPFWSPDGRFLGFFSGGRLKKIDVSGGIVQDLCKAEIGYGGTWNQEDSIVFAPTWEQPLRHVNAAGGASAPAIDLNGQTGETLQRHPSFLPDGRHFLYASYKDGKSSIALAALRSKERRILIPDSDLAMYAEPGFIVFHTGDLLLAQPFDAQKLQFTAAPRRIAERVDTFAVSAAGVLAYHDNTSAVVQFCWYARDGKQLSDVGTAGDYQEFDLSPDGSRLAIVRPAQPPLPATDIWVLELANGIMSRVTSCGASGPLWSADGRHLIFTCHQNGRCCLFRKEIATGKEELLLSAGEETWAKDLSNDGTFAITVCGLGLCQLPLAGERKQEDLVRNEFDKDTPALSRDGRWFAYDCSESGRFEVYAVSFPGMTQKIQVSNAGGAQPKWRGDGRELFYLGLDGRMMAVEAKIGMTLTTGAPRALFQTRIRTSGDIGQYHPTLDGQRFLLAQPVDQAPDAITVVVNFTAGLQV